MPENLPEKTATGLPATINIMDLMKRRDLVTEIPREILPILSIHYSTMGPGKDGFMNLAAETKVWIEKAWSCTVIAMRDCFKEETTKPEQGIKMARSYAPYFDGSHTGALYAEHLKRFAAGDAAIDKGLALMIGFFYDGACTIAQFDLYGRVLDSFNYAVKTRSFCPEGDDQRPGAIDVPITDWNDVKTQSKSSGKFYVDPKKAGAKIQGRDLTEAEFEKVTAAMNAQKTSIEKWFSK